MFGEKDPLETRLLAIETLLMKIAEDLTGVHRVAHKCYRPGCGCLTTNGTAWCQKCLDEADERKKQYQRIQPRPIPKPPRIPMKPWRC